SLPARRLCVPRAPRSRRAGPTSLRAPADLGGGPALLRLSGRIRGCPAGGWRPGEVDGGRSGPESRVGHGLRSDPGRTPGRRGPPSGPPVVEGTDRACYRGRVGLARHGRGGGPRRGSAAAPAETAPARGG